MPMYSAQQIRPHCMQYVSILAFRIKVWIPRLCKYRIRKVAAHAASDEWPEMKDSLKLFCKCALRAVFVQFEKLVSKAAVAFTLHA